MKLKPLCAALALAAAGLSSAQAAPLLSITPAQQNVAVGGVASVNIVISGLSGINEIVSGFSLQVAYDTGLLEFFNLDLAPGVIAMGGDPNNAFGPVLFGFALVAGGGDATSSLSDAELDGLQGDSFTLMTLAFKGVAQGVSFLNFGPDPDMDRLVTGRLDGPPPTGIAGVLALDYRGACIAVGDAVCPNQVPEPASYGLAGLALLGCGLATMRRQRQRGSATA